MRHNFHLELGKNMIKVIESMLTRSRTDRASFAGFVTGDPDPVK